MGVFGCFGGIENKVNSVQLPTGTEFGNSTYYLGIVWGIHFTDLLLFLLNQGRCKDELILRDPVKIHWLKRILSRQTDF